MTNLNIIFVLIIYMTRTLTFEIDDHSPDQIVTEGQTVTLFCHVSTNLIDGNDNWKTCRWSRDKDGATCLYEYQRTEDDSGWEIKEFCEPFLSDTKYFGSDPNVENHICGIDVLSADSFDSGNWTCWIEECKTEVMGGCEAKTGNGNRVKATVFVQVIHIQIIRT